MKQGLDLQGLIVDRNAIEELINRVKHESSLCDEDSKGQILLPTLANEIDETKERVIRKPGFPDYYHICETYGSHDPITPMKGYMLLLEVAYYLGNFGDDKNQTRKILQYTIGQIREALCFWEDAKRAKTIQELNNEVDKHTEKKNEALFSNPFVQYISGGSVKHGVMVRLSYLEHNDTCTIVVLNAGGGAHSTEFNNDVFTNSIRYTSSKKYIKDIIDCFLTAAVRDPNATLYKKSQQCLNALLRDGITVTYDKPQRKNNCGTRSLRLMVEYELCRAVEGPLNSDLFDEVMRYIQIEDDRLYCIAEDSAVFKDMTPVPLIIKEFLEQKIIAPLTEKKECDRKTNSRSLSK